MSLIDIWVAIVWGIVEGITEWLPISSTGHMILVEQFLDFSDKINSTFGDLASHGFSEMFLVVVQLGAIMAVVVLFWKKLFPFNMGALGKKNTESPKEKFVKMDIMTMWFKIVVACLPAIIIVALGIDDKAEAIFYNAPVVAAALIVYGVLFIAVEILNKGKKPKINSMAEITYQAALVIGVFQLLAALVPGTSRSGATIIGALIIGVSRGLAAEFTFFLAVPVMFGASLMKLVKYASVMTPASLGVLLIGMVVAFVVSIFVIKFFMGYIRKHDFKIFGYYRITLGIIVLIMFFAGVIS